MPRNIIPILGSQIIMLVSIIPLRIDIIVSVILVGFVALLSAAGEGHLDEEERLLQLLRGEQPHDRAEGDAVEEGRPAVGAPKHMELKLPIEKDYGLKRVDP